VWVLGLVSTQKTRMTLIFLFSPSNKNCGKAFAIPFLKKISSFQGKTMLVRLKMER
jgi:hypothetical protein